MMAEDEELIGAAREGNEDAFRTLVDRYGRPVFSVAYRMTGDRDDAQDIVQTVFLKVYRNLGGFDASHRLFSWIYRAAVNESLNLLARRAARGSICPEGNGTATDPETALRSAERDRRMQVALMRLSPEHRSVVILRHLRDCSYEEIGAVLEIPEKMVKSRLFAARARLREICAEEGLLPASRVSARKAVIGKP